MSNVDWPEDAGHWNGNYQNKCLNCGCTFVGLKRRVLCRVCHEIGPIEAEGIFHEQECPAPIQWPTTRASIVRRIQTTLDERDARILAMEEAVRVLAKETTELRTYARLVGPFVVHPVPPTDQNSDIRKHLRTLAIVELDMYECAVQTNNNPIASAAVEKARAEA